VKGIHDRIDGDLAPGWSVPKRFWAKIRCFPIALVAMSTAFGVPAQSDTSERGWLPAARA
jgi:hypothetical protein